MMSNFRISISPGTWVVMALGVLVLPLPWLFAMIVSSAVHEFCHVAAVIITGNKVTELRICVEGMYMETTPMNPVHSSICSLAGPIGALFLLAFARWIPKTALCALVQSGYHLLPLYPHDGGRALRSLLSGFPGGDRICVLAERVVLTVLTFGGLYFTFVVRLGILPLGLACLLIFRTWQEKLLANRR